MNIRNFLHSVLRIFIGVLWLILLLFINVIFFEKENKYLDFHIKFSLIVFVILLISILVQYFLKKRFPDSRLIKKANFKVNSKLSGKDIPYYSRDWLKSVFLSGMDATYFDLMVEGDFFYIIKLPANHGSAINALAAGLITRKSSWPLIGLIYGGLMNKRERTYYRSGWLNLRTQLTKEVEAKDLYLKIPLSDFDKHVSFDKNKINISYEGETFSLSKETPPFLLVSRRKEINRLKKVLGK